MKKKVNCESIIYSNKYNNNIWTVLLFEIRSLIGRTFFNKKPPIQKIKQILNLGCGSLVISGFINSDFYNGLLPWTFRKMKNIWMQDYRFRLNCPSDYWDGVFTEHTIEHLNPNEVKNLLTEIQRTLKSNKWLRISVPDLEKHINIYNNWGKYKYLKYWDSKAEVIWSLTQYWGHRSVWDFDLLKSFLLEAGFSKVNKVSYKKGTDKLLIQDNKIRGFGSLYVEAQK